MNKINKVHDSRATADLNQHELDERKLIEEQKNDLSASIKSGGVFRELPEHEKIQINQESMKLYESLRVEMGANYRGTDPLIDAEKIYKEKIERLHGSQLDVFDNTGETKVDSPNPDYPFENYGLGITSYFRLIKVLTWVFVIITIIGGIPVTILYSTQSGYDENDKGLLIKQMVGNLGESYHECHSKYFESADDDLVCKVGLITELAYAGIVPY